MHLPLLNYLTIAGKIWRVFPWSASVVSGRVAIHILQLVKKSMTFSIINSRKKRKENLHEEWSLRTVAIRRIYTLFSFISPFYFSFICSVQHFYVPLSKSGIGCCRAHIELNFNTSTQPRGNSTISTVILSPFFSVVGSTACLISSSGEIFLVIFQISNL